MKKCFLGTCNCTVLLFGAALILGGALPASAQIDKNMCCLADGGCEDLSVETCENGKGISYAGRSCDPDLDISRCSGSGTSCKRNVDCPAGQTCEPDGNGQCPDCNCDGAHDAKEIGDCTAQCVDGGGNQADCRDACSIECGGNLVPKKCDLKNCRDDSGCVDVNACDQCRADTGKCGPRDCGDGNKCSIDFCEETDASVCQDEDGNGSQDECTSTAECDTVGEKCVFQGWQCVHDPDDSICDDNDACTDDICNVNTGGSKDYDSCCKPDANGTCRPVIVPDGGYPDDAARCEISVTDEGYVTDVDVRVTILHPWVGDMIVELEHKDTGTKATLINHTCDEQLSEGNGFFGFNINGLVDAVFGDDGCTVLDGETCGPTPFGWADSWIGLPVCVGGNDGANCFNVGGSCEGTGTCVDFNPFCPNTALKAFDGESKLGTWSLNVFDDFDDGGTSSTKGTLEDWTLILENAPKGCFNPALQAINDGIDCTNDDCNPFSGEIFHDENDAKCNDGDNCTADTCDPDAVDADGEPLADKAGCLNELIDKDGDGCCDKEDACPSDPNKCASEGVCGCQNPDSDKDKDGVLDCFDDCPNDAKCWDEAGQGCKCNDMNAVLIVRGQPSGLNTAPNAGRLPADDTTHLQNGCFVVELWAQATNGTYIPGQPNSGPGADDATQGGVQKSGLSCVFVEVLWKDGCEFKATTIEHNDTYDQFRAGKIDNNGFDDDGFADITNLGGCTLDKDAAGGGVGAFPRWHRVATVFYETAHSKCKNTFQLGDTEKPSSLKNDELVKNRQYEGTEVAIECLGSIYNLGKQGDSGQGQITPGDFSLFAPCWMAGSFACLDAVGGGSGDDCESDDDCSGGETCQRPDLDGDGQNGKACGAADFDCDGFVGPGDLAFFATAWQKDVCGNGILVPSCQLSCGDGADDLPWADEALMREFNLPVPPRDWQGWALDPARGKAVRSNSTTGRRARR